MEQGLRRGRSTFLGAHRASPCQHHCTTARKGGGDKILSEPSHTGHRCSLSQETRRDCIYSPGHSKSQCLHTARAPSSPAPRPSMQKLGAVVKGKWACYRKSHGSDRVVRTTGGRGLFAWRCTPPAPGASVPAARPAPAGTGSAAARPAWHCGRCA